MLTTYSGRTAARLDRVLKLLLHEWAAKCRQRASSPSFFSYVGCWSRCNPCLPSLWITKKFGFCSVVTSVDEFTDEMLNHVLFCDDDDDDDDGGDSCLLFPYAVDYSCYARSWAIPYRR